MAQKTCMDDLSVLILTDESGSWMEDSPMPMIKAELELSFGTNPEATASFAPSFVGIGTL